MAIRTYSRLRGWAGGQGPQVHLNCAIFTQQLAFGDGRLDHLVPGMTDDELLALFRLPESDRVERKERLSDKDRIRQAICAHANDLPNHQQTGVIFVGQRDDLSCAGIRVDDELLLTLAGFRSDGLLLPFPTMANLGEGRAASSYCNG